MIIGFISINRLFKQVKKMFYKVSILYRLTVQKKLERYRVKKFLVLVILLGLVPTVSVMASSTMTSNDLNQQLLKEMESGGDVDKVLELIEKGADVNIQNYQGCTALMWAVEKGDPKVCLALIEKGVDVNAIDVFSSTALMHAVKFSETGICRIILSHAIILPKPLNEDCLLTILCMFNRFKVSKDIRYYILGKLPSESLIGLLMPCKKCPLLFKNSLVEKIEEHTIEQLIPMMGKARAEASGELRNLLDPEQFSKNFGKELHSTIEKVVDDNKFYLYKLVIQADDLNIECSDLMSAMEECFALEDADL